MSEKVLSKNMHRILLTLLAVTATASAADPTPSEVLESVRRHVPSAAITTARSDNALLFAGHYSQSPEVTLHTDNLAGDHLYLFPDSSYIYTEWADVLPETIFEKGTWSFENGIIALQSNMSVGEKHRAKRDHKFIPMTAEVGGNRQLFILGIPYKYRYFREHSKAGGNFMFHLCARMRIAQISKSDAASTKTRLMKKAWKPEWFRE